MKNEGRTAAYGAIAAIVALIAILGVFNYYSSGWDQYLGLQGSSFLTVFLTILGLNIIVGAITFGLWHLLTRPKKRRRAKFEELPLRNFRC